MKRILKQIEQKKEYFIVFFSILILVNFIYAIKGLYPYGKMTIINGDMGQGYVPFYYYLHDLLHGKADFMMNYNIGYGQDMYDVTAIYGFLSPVSWLIGLTNRSNIPNFMNTLFMIRLCLIGLSSFWVLKRLFKHCDFFYLYIFSILYAFSGYILGYYTNFVWLDNVILFPLLFYFLIQILTGKKGIWYMVLLAISWSLSFYISFMESLFILFFSFLYLHFYVDKKDRKKVIMNLVIHTIFALLISMMFWLPVIIQVMNTVRLNIGGGNYTVEKTKVFTKFITLIFYSLPILGCTLYFFSKKNTKKEKYFSFLLLLFFGIGVFIEPINIMWHTGSYLEFPLRYGFITIWIIYYISLHYFEKMSEVKKEEKLWYYYITAILFLLLIFIGSRYFVKINSADPALGIKSENLFIWCFMFFVVSTIICSFCLLFKDRKIKKILLILLVFLEICVHSFAYIGVSSNKLSNSHSDAVLFASNDVYNLLKEDDNNIKRYKNLDNSLYENSPLIVSKPFLTTWHLTEKYLQKNHRLLGYATVSSKLMDGGGTLFSDYILGVNRVFSEKKQDEAIYKFIRNENNLNLYESTFNGDFGIVYPKSNYKQMFFGINPYDAQNKIYQTLFDKEDDIIQILPISIEDKDNIKMNKNEYKVSTDISLDFHYYLEEKSNLYFYSFVKEAETNGIVIMVNGEIINFPTIDYSENYLYNNDVRYSNGIADLGIYEGDVTVQLFIKKDTIFSSPSLAYMPIKKLEELSHQYQNKVIVKKKNDKLYIKTIATKDQALFLPIGYYDGYECTVNGKRVKPKTMLNSFISIDLEEGENNIVLSYFTPFLKISFIYSFGSLLLYIIGYFILKKKKIENNLLDNFVYICYHLVFCAGFIAVYIYSFFR